MIGKTIKRYREERNISQKDLADVTGLTQAYLSQIENGKRQNITIGTLQKLASAFGITVQELMDASNLPAQPPSEGLPTEWLRELQKIEHRLTPRDRSVILKMANSLLRPLLTDLNDAAGKKEPDHADDGMDTHPDDQENRI